ncbi:low temperature requirement protein A [Microlunatus soli]|uniref:Low temperature requirement protein LtrA n=1 Tax=Microlunatus soli TaxID=630515 RepID=A0A1H1R3N3_9ACTN|nr:low temperature requirement protein A [Microlunatus soli]SDS30165.1 Low temperature requirement protein LtrA [Microlunatus soli]
MPSPTGPLIRAIRPRDPDEQHRVATPLELLTDLCFVVAVAQTSVQLHHAFVEGEIAHGLIGFAMAFMAIWWTWLNFTWFASAYDNDDVIYRLLTILQIVGSLIIAAGVEAMFDGHFTIAVIGYIVMRVALVAQWLRAARQDPGRAITCRRYAVGIIAVQVLWVIFLFLPSQAAIPVWVLIMLCEFAVPVFAERRVPTTWHPHHVAERYSLFFIIVLGEVILSTMTSIQQVLAAPEQGGHGGEAGQEVQSWTFEHPEVLIVATSGVAIVFSLWWLYFSRSAAATLIRFRMTGSGQSYLWGYGHYLIFASAAAIGAGLGARVDYWNHEGEVSALGSAALITGAVAILMTALWVLHLRFHDASWRTVVPFAVAVVAVLGSTFTPVPELITAVICIVLLIIEVRFAGLVNTAE